jgi:predicted esterase
MGLETSRRFAWASAGSPFVVSFALTFLGACGGTQETAAPTPDSGAPADARAEAGVGHDGGPPDTSSGETSSADAASPTGCQSCADCAGKSGSFEAQPLAVGGESRHYYLHVPPGYDCGKPTPVLVDFHGTAEGVESDNVEEYYALDAMNAVADQEGFIVVRPRSRSAPISGSSDSLYQWDANSGDIPKNIAFTDALVKHLESEYRIDPKRAYASGFSNGTNMAIHFLGDPDNPFHGYAIVEGGLFSYDGAVTHAPFTADAPRVYATTGYRDYIYETLIAFEGYLKGLTYPSANLWVRATDSAHELYGWDYTELWGWLDHGTKTGPPGTLASAWTRETSMASKDDILHLTLAPSGNVIATGSGGDFWQRTPEAAWSLASHIDSPIPIYTDLCITPSGVGFAVGQQGLFATTSNGGQSWVGAASLPEFDTMDYFGYSYLNAIACGASQIVGGGYWSAAVSQNSGVTWAAGSMVAEDYPVQAATVAVSAAGTWIAGGYYDYVGRSTDGVTFTDVTPASPTIQWFTAIASAPSGLWWAVGEQGTIVQSTDDGMTWSAESSTVADDFYGVAFANANVGMAVGRNGQAVVTRNGGATWSDVSTGLNLFLSGVLWLDSSTALVSGEAGTVLRFAVP